MTGLTPSEDAISISIDQQDRTSQGAPGSFDSPEPGAPLQGGRPRGSSAGRGRAPAAFDRGGGAGSASSSPDGGPPEERRRQRRLREMDADVGADASLESRWQRDGASQ